MASANDSDNRSFAKKEKEKKKQETGEQSVPKPETGLHAKCRESIIR